MPNEVIVRQSEIGRLHELLGQPNNNHHVIIHELVTKESLTDLQKFIQEKLPTLAFNRLTLTVDAETLQSPQFTQLLQTLKGSELSGLSLLFSTSSANDVVKIEQLAHEVAQNCYVPLYFGTTERANANFSDKICTIEQGIQETVIQNIRTKHTQSSKAPIPLKSSLETQWENHPLSEKKIALKKHQAAERIVLPIDVEHVEEIEQEAHVSQEEQLEVTETVEAQVSVSTVQGYSRELIGFQEFSSERYKNLVTQTTKNKETTAHLYRLLRQELFANLPYAIKYVSPEAAEVLARFLPSLVSINKDNLPNGFLLKKTAQGELVLDYDAFVDNETANEYTPQIETYSTTEPIYQVTLPEELQSWIKSNTLITDCTPLTNLWIKSGDDGVKEFLTKLKDSTGKPFVLNFIIKQYLIHQPQWDNLNNPAFFEGLTQLKTMYEHDATQFSWLTQFLQNTGSSCYQLNSTLAAFNKFWTELTCKCLQQKVPLTDLENPEWSTPAGGNPVVYMERMLTILRNSRSLKDQIANLKRASYDTFRLPGINLCNYGAYYASRYEDYKSVSPLMLLNYNPDEQDKYPFNECLSLYKASLAVSIERLNLMERYEDYKEKGTLFLVRKGVDLTLSFDELKSSGCLLSFSVDGFGPEYECYHKAVDGPFRLVFDSAHQIPADGIKIPFGISAFEFDRLKEEYIRKIEKDPEFNTHPDRIYKHLNAMALRCLGMQKVGMSVHEFTKWMGNNVHPFYKSSRELFTALMFVAHHRYQGTSREQLQKYGFLELLDRAQGHEVGANLLSQLQRLYQSGNYLNELDALRLLPILAYLNTHEFERSGLNADDKKAIIEKLFFFIQEYPRCAAKFYHKILPRDPYILSALSAAQLLIQKEPSLMDGVIADSLLTFTLRLSQEHVNGANNFEQDKTNSFINVCSQEDLNKMLGYLTLINRLSGEGEANKYYFAFQQLLGCDNKFSIQTFNSIFDIVADNDVHLGDVLGILDAYGLKPQQQSLPPMMDIESDKDFLRKLLVKLHEPSLHEKEIKKHHLFKESINDSIEELKTKVNKAWDAHSEQLLQQDPTYLYQLLEQLKETRISYAFHVLEPNKQLSALSRTLMLKTGQFIEYSRPTTLERVNEISEEVNLIARLVLDMQKNDCTQSEEFHQLFADLDCSKLTATMLTKLLELISHMSRRNHYELTKQLLKDTHWLSDSKNAFEIISCLDELHENALPTMYLTQFFQITSALPKQSTISNEQFKQQIITLFNRDNHDKILAFIMQPKLPMQIREKVLQITNGITNNRPQIMLLLQEMQHKGQLDSFLTEVQNATSVEHQRMIIEVTTKSHLMTPKKARTDSVDYAMLAKNLASLKGPELLKLQSTPLSTPCMHAVLTQWNQGIFTNLDELILQFEKEPFGQRDYQSQFPTEEVERVINNSYDLLNGTPYPYRYRKKLMEAFLFVNAIGNDLKVYEGKSARELSNKELKQAFLQLKMSKKSSITDYQRRLLALGLIREVMYRSTGDFPYSTQMIAVIDSMMHQGDYISNIDTGQGKSLIDSMKASLLWLESDRVDVTTSSLVDAKRDIDTYSHYFSALGIPYGKTPISSTSSIDDFQQKGVNLSTVAQMSLFIAKAHVQNLSFETPKTKVSLIANESDYTILDDRVTYRFATNDGSGISVGQEWIYEGINEFIDANGLSNPSTSAIEDVLTLKNFLKEKAKGLKKSAKVLDKFIPEQYVIWLESALMVKNHLKENVHYVIPAEPEKVNIQGRICESKVVKILMKDGKVSPDSVFGNGMQQLLYARLNQQLGKEEFVILPQNRTIISTNNKNLIDYYRSKKGFIWGSSGTVGSIAEIKAQYQKYGFEFSKIEPHHKKQVQSEPPICLENEEQQFIRLVHDLNNSSSTLPNVVFCKDIETAKRLHQMLLTQYKDNTKLQLYVGHGAKEEDIIERAREEGMITVTTSALGRNTDIKYDRTKGLNVWHTCVDSIRSMSQKSGRTGRQGSPGMVKMYLNQGDLNTKSIAELQQDIDDAAAKEREQEEVLYDVLGFLLHKVETLQEKQFKTHTKSDFLLKKWSTFSETVEREFRDARSKINDPKTRDEFIKKTLAHFNQLMAPEVLDYQPSSIDDLPNDVNTRLHKEQYYAELDAVTKDKCAPVELIAYHLLDYPIGKSVDKNAIKKQVITLFEHIEKGHFKEANQGYLRFLMEHEVTKQSMVEVHKEFITEFLSQPKPGFLRKLWEQLTGAKRKLNTISDNNHYLVMFHTFALQGADVSIDTIKASVNHLLDEYVENAWFISSDRKQWVASLKQDIAHATNSVQLIQILNLSSTRLQDKDIETNTSRTKPIHFFGSRLHQTLNKAVKLASALGGEASINTSTADDKKMDKYNENIQKEYKKTLNEINELAEPNGMQGRDERTTKPK